MDGVVGIVAGLARYPVKSVRGEQLAEVELEPRGVVGDRRWAAYTPDGGLGSGKTTPRFRRVDGLLDLRATGAPVPVLELPDGQCVPVDRPAASTLLSAALGRPLVLRPEADVPHHDEAPVHLVTTAALRRLGELLGGPA